MEGLTLQMCFAGLTPWSNGSALSKPIKTAIESETGEPHGDQLWSDTIDPTSFVDALTKAGQDRLQAFSTGIFAYQTHTYQRTVATPPFWSGPQNIPVLDYGGPEDGPPVLVVPSLINRAYVLDLFEDRSFMRAMSSKGLRAYLLDWTAPDSCLQGADITTYIEELLIPALGTLKEMHGRAPVLAGYCMGGTLAAAPAALYPDLVSALVLLAAPWDFHSDTEGMRHWLSLSRSRLEALIDSLGKAPADLLQGLFAGLDPTLVGRKFRKFAAMDSESEEAMRFVVLEDWLNDGVSLAGPVARECLFEWYLENTPERGQWHINGQSIRPENIQCPSLAVIPARDRIVPPKSAQALAKSIPGADVHSVALGHIGMMTSGRAAQEVFKPVAEWIMNAASQ